jgi:hypothetical protein
VDLRPGVAVVPATQATHLSSSRKVTSTSSSSSIRGSFLSSSSTVRTTSKEEIRTSARTTRHPPSCTSNQPEQPSSSSARRRPRVFPLWGTRLLGEPLPKESSSAAASSQCPCQAECIATRRRQPWAASCPVWKGEPPIGRHSPRDPRSALGTFSVKYHSANVLFNTEATHSFVTTSWVGSHNIPVALMYPPMRASSISGRTQTDRFCPSARVQIGGYRVPR